MTEKAQRIAIAILAFAGFIMAAGLALALTGCDPGPTEPTITIVNQNGEGNEADQGDKDSHDTDDSNNTGGATE